MDERLIIKVSIGWCPYLFYYINTIGCPDIDKVTYNSALAAGRIGTDGNFSEDIVADVPGKFLKIFQGDDPNVRRVVPGVGQLIILRGNALTQQLQADRIMAEIGEADDDLSADPRQGVQQPCRLENLLQGLAENDVIEAAVGIVIHLFVEVALQDAQTPGDAGRRLGRVLLDAGTDDLFIVGQPGQKVAVAAAEVEDAAAGFDGRGDDPQVKADGVCIRQDHRKTL